MHRAVFIPLANDDHRRTAAASLDDAIDPCFDDPACRDQAAEQMLVETRSRTGAGSRCWRSWTTSPANALAWWPIPRYRACGSAASLTSHAILRWQDEHGILWHYIAPCKPQRNGFMESTLTSERGHLRGQAQRAYLDFFRIMFLSIRQRVQGRRWPETNAILACDPQVPSRPWTLPTVLYVFKSQFATSRSTYELAESGDIHNHTPP